jgi:hypothetical protein
LNPVVLRQRPLINRLSHGTAHEWCGGRNWRLRDRRSSHSWNFNVPLPLVDLLLVLQQVLTASLPMSHQSTGSITWFMSNKLSSLCSWLASESENGVSSLRFWSCYCRYDPALTARHCVGWTTSVKYFLCLIFQFHICFAIATMNYLGRLLHMDSTDGIKYAY